MYVPIFERARKNIAHHTRQEAHIVNSNATSRCGEKPNGATLVTIICLGLLRDYRRTIESFYTCNLGCMRIMPNATYDNQSMRE